MVSWVTSFQFLKDRFVLCVQEEIQNLPLSEDYCYLLILLLLIVKKKIIFVLCFVIKFFRAIKFLELFL